MKGSGHMCAPRDAKPALERERLLEANVSLSLIIDTHERSTAAGGGLSMLKHAYNYLM
jgi:hypothetical protein